MTEEEVPEILEMPIQERPRERLLSHGSETLSDAELLAVLLRTGGPGLPVMSLARELLDEWRGLGGMPGLAYRDLRRRGLGKAKASSLLAAVEIGRRLALGKLQAGDVLSRPSSVASYLMLRYGQKDQEVMGALFLDSRHRLIASQEFFRGTLQRASVEPRAILKAALLRGSAAIILFHTHPSGDPTPSNDDILFTRRMVEAGEWVGIRVVDHFILGTAGNFVSLQQRGECQPPKA